MLSRPLTAAGAWAVFARVVCAGVVFAGAGLAWLVMLAAPAPVAVANDANADLIGDRIVADRIDRSVERSPLQPARIAPSPANPKINWRVENAFRLFTDPAHTAMHRATFEELTLEERRSPVLAAERQLAARFRDGWAAEVIDDTCWDSWRNRYACPKSKDPYAKPTSHVVLAKVDGVPDAEFLTCSWFVLQGGKAKTKKPQKPQKRIETGCNAPARFTIPFPEGAWVEVAIGGRRIARQRIEVRDIFIVGLGDSFGSGEGNPDVPVRFSPERAASYDVVAPAKTGAAVKGPVRTDLVGLPARIGAWTTIGDLEFMKHNARWLDQACHRSLYSHQMRAALQLAIEDPHRAVTFASFACSGAEVTRGLFLRYKGNEWVPNPPDVSQISATARLQCGNDDAPLKELPEAYHIKGAVSDLEGTVVLHKCPHEKARPIDLVFVSIGGNDIGFARLLANTILMDQSLLRQLGGWLGQVHGQSEAKERLDTLDERLKALNRALHGILHVPWKQSDRVMLTAYPEMALLGDGTSICPSGSAGMEIVRDFSLDANRAKEGVWVADKLNRKMEASARRHGWTFVESHRSRFIGRGICAGFTEQAFSIADDLRLPRKVDGAWVPYNPSQFRPYAERQRWFRTPNDAFMTSNFHVSASLLQKALKFRQLSWFQLILASTYSGAFHPTGEGHAAMADALVEQSRAVLDRYGQTSREDRFAVSDF